MRRLVLATDYGSRAFPSRLKECPGPRFSSESAVPG
jgi:hypothetical protein